MFNSDWLTSGSLIIRCKLGRGGTGMLESFKGQATSLFILFSWDRCLSDVLLCLTMLCSWWRSRAKRQHWCRYRGNAHYDSLLGVLHHPVLGCRSCMSTMAHIKRRLLCQAAKENHRLDSWKMDLFCSWRPAAIRYVLHQGLGPCKAWWQGSWCFLVGGCAPVQWCFPHENSQSWFVHSAQ